MKTIFWNVDTQYDFMRNDGNLYVPGSETIEDNLQKMTWLAKDKDIQVVNTADLHDENTFEISDEPDGVDTFPKHCMRGDRGAEYIDATAPESPYVVDWQDEMFFPEGIRKSRNIVIYKDRFDVFKGNPHTDDVLKAIEPDRVIVYGVATNFCVDYAVMGLLERGLEVYVATDAIKEIPGIPYPLSLEATLDKWISNDRNAAKLIKTADVLGYL